LYICNWILASTYLSLSRDTVSVALSKLAAKRPSEEEERRQKGDVTKTESETASRYAVDTYTYI
jgi:hypothetical protein